jgi:hypothetical protein
MSPLAISLVSFSVIFGGTLFGMLMSSRLSEHHVSDESKDAVKMGIGMIATMAALVLGLLIASAKATFDTASTGIREAGANVILLDRVLTQYGPEMKETRELLRRGVASLIERVWPEEKVGPAVAKAREERVDIEVLQDKLRQLTPRTDAQRLLQSRALQISDDIAKGRWLLTAQMGQRSIPMPFLVMLVFWLTFIFATFGLFAPRNAIVIVIFLVCALSAAGSLYLILELETPYGGLTKVSSAPMRNALAVLGQVVVPGPSLQQTMP